ncbi:MAG: carboxypeptidase-like regulatory domain-containing protein [Pseudomonadota bacterium]
MPTQSDTDAPVLTIDLAPQPVDAGAALTMVIHVDAPFGALGGAGVVLTDATGTELGRAPVVVGDDGLPVATIALDAPALPGDHQWQVALVPLPSDAAPRTATLTACVLAHPIGLTLWDMPDAVQAGRDFTFRLGLKCPCGCGSAHWPFVVQDQTGAQVAAGTVGDAPWPGTDALCHAQVTLTAPTIPGVQDWAITALPPHHALPHIARTLPLRVTVTPAADATLTVIAVDAATGAPVDRAKVVAHPFRAFTDASGRATLHLPQGTYTVFVSGKQYFAHRQTVEVSDTATLHAPLHIDHAFSDADTWA